MVNHSGQEGLKEGAFPFFYEKERCKRKESPSCKAKGGLSVDSCAFLIAMTGRLWQRITFLCYEAFARERM